MNFRKWLESVWQAWGTEAAGCIAIAQDTKKILVAFRSGRVVSPNLCWSTFGGAIKGISHEQSTTPAKGALIEFKEESGYNGPITKMIKCYLFRGNPEEGKIPYHNFIVIVPREFEPQLNWENDDARWVTFEELMALSPKHPGFVDFLNHDQMKIKKLTLSV